MKEEINNDYYCNILTLKQKIQYNITLFDN